MNGSLETTTKCLIFVTPDDLSKQSESQTAISSASETRPFRQDISLRFSYLISGSNGDSASVKKGINRSSTLEDAQLKKNIQWQ